MSLADVLQLVSQPGIKPSTMAPVMLAIFESLIRQTVQ